MGGRRKSLGIPTLKIRMREHERNALAIAEFLQMQSCVSRVSFPALLSHPQYELAKKQMDFIPGLFCADFSSVEIAEQFIHRTKIFGEKCSFGSPDSRIEIPAKISHATFSDSELKAIGVLPSTVRFSIGLENIEDLISDIKQALCV